MPNGSYRASRISHGFRLPDSTCETCITVCSGSAHVLTLASMQPKLCEISSVWTTSQWDVLGMGSASFRGSGSLDPGFI